MHPSCHASKNWPVSHTLALVDVLYFNRYITQLDLRDVTIDVCQLCIIIRETWHCSQLSSQYTSTLVRSVCSHAHCEVDGLDEDENEQTCFDAVS